MSRIRKRLPSPAMIVAIVARMAASAGTSFAAIGLSGLSKGAKDETVGVGVPRPLGVLGRAGPRRTCRPPPHPAGRL